MFLGQVFTFPQVAQPCAKLEFRLAETEPAKDLSEVTLSSDKKKLYLHKEPIITNKDIVEAHAHKRFYHDGLWVDEQLLKSLGGDTLKSKVRCNVTLEFTKQAAQRLENITNDNQLRVMAILMYGEIIFAPVIHGKLYDRASLDGEGMTYDEAERIAQKITNRCK